MAEFRYILEPYKGPRSRVKCPACGKQREFSKYIDSDTGELLPDHVGRCNREGKCGYHLTPSQYFASFGVVSESLKLVKPPLQEIKPAINFIPNGLVQKSMNDFMSSNFAIYLNGLFAKVVAEQLILKYLVGRSKADCGHANIFWRIDKDGRARTGKIMAYNPDTGKRRKDITPTWVHVNMKPFNYELCFFGEHLITEFPDKPVALVESEKTAIISSVYMPQFNWIATGGASGCKWRDYSVHKVFENKNVILFPDFGFYNRQKAKTCFQEWSDRAQEIMERLNCKIEVCPILEENIDQCKRINDYDLADFLIRRDDQFLCAMADEGYPISWDYEIQNYESSSRSYS